MYNESQINLGKLVIAIFLCIRYVLTPLFIFSQHHRAQKTIIPLIKKDQCGYLSILGELSILMKMLLCIFPYQYYAPISQYILFVFRSVLDKAVH